MSSIRLPFPGVLAALSLAALNGCRPANSEALSTPGGFTPAPEPHRLDRTLTGALNVCAPLAKQRFEPACRANGIAWPPARITLLAFKQERILEVWGANPSGKFARIARFPILAASGRLGPKFRRGDMQVPEGFYRLDSLNPASRFHLSLRVGYPNANDIARSTIPRSRMGGDIYVHGNAVSAGCIALGDGPIEDVFTLVALANRTDRNIIISPVDFRTGANGPQAAGSLYERLRRELRQFGGPERGPQ